MDEDIRGLAARSTFVGLGRPGEANLTPDDRDVKRRTVTHNAVLHLGCLLNITKYREIQYICEYIRNIPILLNSLVHRNTNGTNCLTL